MEIEMEKLRSGGTAVLSASDRHTGHDAHVLRKSVTLQTLSSAGMNKTEESNATLPRTADVTSISLIMRARSGMTRKLYDKMVKREGKPENIAQAVEVHKTLRLVIFTRSPRYSLNTALLTPSNRFTRTACAQKLGFANAELLQKTDWAQVKIDPRKSSPRLPKWIWAHDAESYAHENYGKCAETIGKGMRLEDDERIPPNYPRGYRFEPWSIDDIMADLRAGREVDLGPGEWF